MTAGVASLSNLNKRSEASTSGGLAQPSTPQKQPRAPPAVLVYGTLFAVQVIFVLWFFVAKIAMAAVDLPPLGEALRVAPLLQVPLFLFASLSLHAPRARAALDAAGLAHACGREKATAAAWSSAGRRTRTAQNADTRSLVCLSVCDVARGGRCCLSGHSGARHWHSIRQPRWRRAGHTVAAPPSDGRPRAAHVRQRYEA